MLLNKLLKRKSLIVLGINSGTSADSLDLCAVRISRTESKKNIKVLAHRNYRFPDSLRKQIHHQIHCNKITPESIIQLDNILGMFIGLKAKALTEKLRMDKITVDLIASHGQTIRHRPARIKLGQYLINGTLQIGSLDFIAAQCGKVVIGNFRQADIAVGNEGAPITTGAMKELFSAIKPRLIINIGGISNYFYFPSEKSKNKISAADCGPGNSLCDLLAEKLFNKPFDKNGAIARKGAISQRLLSLLLSKPFFSNKQISTGREEFGLKTAGDIIDFGKSLGLSDEDLMASVAELTILGILNGVKILYENDAELDKLYLTGGGRKNTFFRERLNGYLPDIEIRLIDELGIDGDFVEAAAYAVLGEASLRSESLENYRHKDKKDVLIPILGHIVQPPKVRN